MQLPSTTELYDYFSSPSLTGQRALLPKLSDTAMSYVNRLTATVKQQKDASPICKERRKWVRESKRDWWVSEAEKRQVVLKLFDGLAVSGQEEKSRI